MVGSGVARPVDLPMSVYWIEPPYRGLEPVRVLSASAGAFKRNAIVALGVDEPERDVPLLAECVRVVRAMLPWCPLALRVEAASAREILQVARVAAYLRVRCVIVGDEDVEWALRWQLTEPEYLPGDIVAWLRLLGAGSDFVTLIIERIFAGTFRRRMLGEILGEAGLGSESKVEKRFREERLPPPRAWQHLAAATFTALRVQRAPQCSLEKQALELGYSERSAVIRQLRAVFGAAPWAVRRTIGWEPWVRRWLERRMRAGYFPGLELSEKTIGGRSGPLTASGHPPYTTDMTSDVQRTRRTPRARPCGRT